MKIVYIEMSGIGNAVLSTPALQAIKRIYPNCELIVSTWPRSARAYQGLPFVDKVEIDHPTNVLARNFPVDITFISPVGAITTPEMARFTSRIVANPVKVPYTRHESEYKMDLVRQTGYDGATPLPRFGFFDKNVYKAMKFIEDNKLEIGKFICVNASYLRTDHWYLKHWGNENYSQLLCLIQEKYPNLKIVLLGTNEDKNDAEYIKISPAFISRFPYCESKVKIACGWSEDVGDTAALMNMSCLLVGNDSGLAHIAAGIDLPSVTIFTFTNVVKNRPLGKSSEIAMTECEFRLGCQHGYWKNCAHRNCNKIPPSEIVEKIQKVLPLPENLTK